MATLTVTIAKGSETGAILRRLAKIIELQAVNVPDKVGSGADTVVTFDNAPTTGVVSVQITAGPYQNTSALIA